MATGNALGSVSLVGGGPGDPGLLTIRAKDALERADVLLYDALVSGAVVEIAQRAEKVFVGKRGGNHAMPQSEIEALMIAKARDGLRVVRLKGGDPFVFGRGGEEAQALYAAGIPFEIVPGITSAIAAPAYAGIPVTHRSCNTSFTVLTGHEDPAKPDSTIDWNRLADPAQTLILLMAMGSLEEIARRLMHAGLPPQRPAAVVQDGTRPTQRTVTGTLETIAHDAAKAGLQAPAIVIVGDVVRLREELAWYERLPLFGKRVLVTRPLHQADELARALRLLGAEPVVAPVIRIGPADEHPDAAAFTIDHLHDYRWVLFTSRNGVDAFFEMLASQSKDTRALGGASVGAIGPKTARALRAYGVRADLVPTRYIAEEVARAVVAASSPGDRILLYRAQEAREELPEILGAHGRRVDVVAAYATSFVDQPDFARTVAGCDVITFTSSSTVTGFVHNFGGAAAAARASRDKVIACIGPVTAKTAREAGLNVAVVADEFTGDGIVSALARRIPATR